MCSLQNILTALFFLAMVEIALSRAGTVCLGNTHQAVNRSFQFVGSITMFLVVFYVPLSLKPERLLNMLPPKNCPADDVMAGSTCRRFC